VVFTGSTETAQVIRRSMAAHLAPGAPLIAETGGLNAMIVDSTALPEQAVRDIVASAFQSAGQRCSALRCLYLQEDIAAPVIEMIKGAMEALCVGDPWHLSTDVGPVIDAEARRSILAYLEGCEVLHQVTVPDTGLFVPPSLVRVSGIEDLEREVFGPILHLATYPAGGEGAVIDAINARGFGLTFGLHTRIDQRVQEVSEAIHVGNTYVNRNQIGAVVGSQPFGGEGLSGTGPKAGGPHYLARLSAPAKAPVVASDPGANVQVQARLDAAQAPAGPLSVTTLPGPTGELNRLTTLPRGPVLCLGPGPNAEAAQAEAIAALGGVPVCAGGSVAPEALASLRNLHGVLWWGDAAQGRAYAQALASRSGPILPLMTDMPDAAHAVHERHLCIDTTAAGGNADLLAGRAEL
jgi:RHH-type proline utilization regulon transcriptional repressor/proline dehydrogenase/delta 1-pyrroline-5-carboxylate dehydrogenase